MEMNDCSYRNLTLLAVVVTCFAILWPKIFYPMILSIICPFDSMEDYRDEIQKMNTLRPQMREAMGEARPIEKSYKEGNKALFHPSVRYMTKPHSKGSGAVNFVIPIYTIVIIIFFIYSLLRTLVKTHPEPTHCHRNDQPKIISILKSTKTDDVVMRRKDISQERKTQHALELYGKDKVLTALKTIILEMEDFKGNDIYDSIVS